MPNHRQMSWNGLTRDAPLTGRVFIDESLQAVHALARMNAGGFLSAKPLSYGPEISSLAPSSRRHYRQQKPLPIPAKSGIVDLMTDREPEPAAPKTGEKETGDSQASLTARLQSWLAQAQVSAKAAAGKLAALLGGQKPAAKPQPYSENVKYPPEPGEGRAWRNLWGSLAGAASSLFFLGAIGGLGFAFIYMAPRVPANSDMWNVNRQSAIIVLDRNGEEIAARGARYGEQVEPEELPEFFVQAILSTEDRRFYDHTGVDLRGTLRAAMANARAGGVTEGGSTITQQLAKNLFLSPEQTYTRKIREALLALWLEGHYSKDQILSLYINRIYLGAGAYGVESAAQTYFAKSARDVNLAEAAMIAGLPKAPSTYAPTQNPSGAEKRASDVLDNLLEVGAINPFDAREARQNPAKVINQNTDSDLGYFFDYIAARAGEYAKGVSGDIFVTTTIDQKLQRDAEAAVSAGMTVENRIKGADQAALIAYDAGGALRAMVGGRSYKESQFNRAVQAKRQPGSAFKPFVYAAAMEAGLSPNSRFIDQPVEFAGWAPTNYTDNYIGAVRLTEAMAKSINTVAAQVSERVGPSKVAALAMKLRRAGRAFLPRHRFGRR